MNADLYLMSSPLSDIAASKDRALRKLTGAMIAPQAAKRGGDGTQIDRGQ